MWRRLRGHLWTLAPRLGRSFAAAASGDGAPWSAAVPDERWGSVTLSGRLQHRGGGDLVVLVHGLGGCADGYYMLAAAAACRQLGVSCLRLSLRGADLGGEDFYHAGLTADLAAALASRAIAAYSSVYLLGFSLGGHVALRYATEGPDHRLRAVAGVCSPLELAPAQRSIDDPRGWPYRLYLLRRLRRIYQAVAARRQLPTPLAEVLAARTIRQWDERTVAPRFGFAGADDYYQRASVGPRLRRLAVPALLVASPEDPMVPAAAVDPAARRAGGVLDLRWLVGGHVAFPASLDLGVAEVPAGLHTQTVGWLLRQG